ncbi:MAG: di-trans,poly-cis-decaprenylcistransferase [Clostridiales bacterium]|nr:di-trans,poly-cis-decaprenylcistransferase [Clostridiales bacterium]
MKSKKSNSSITDTADSVNETPAEERSNGAAKNIPRHIGIIMDGNRRWATKRLLPRVAGHKAGVKNITAVVGSALERGVDCVTLYALSTENKGRPKDEVDALVDLIRKKLKSMTRELIERGARITFSGDRSYFPDDVQQIMQDVESENTDTSAQVVNIALNYSGRSEIVRAAKLAAEKGEITEESIAHELYTAELPELDMIVRTGGEKRLSNFLLYQAAYSELFFTDTLWPDFDGKELNEMIDEFSHRSRRFGKL